METKTIRGDQLLTALRFVRFLRHSQGWCIVDYHSGQIDNPVNVFVNVTDAEIEPCGRDDFQTIYRDLSLVRCVTAVVRTVPCELLPHCCNHYRVEGSCYNFKTTDAVDQMSMIRQFLSGNRDLIPNWVVRIDSLVRSSVTGATKACEIILNAFASGEITEEMIRVA